MPKYARIFLTNSSLGLAFLPENDFFGIISHSKKEHNSVSKMFRKPTGFSSSAFSLPFLWVLSCFLP